MVLFVTFVRSTVIRRKTVASLKIEKLNNLPIVTKLILLRKNQILQIFFKFGDNRKYCWLVDSGATRHAVNDLTIFQNLDKSYKSSIELANGETVMIEGIGSGQIGLCDDNGNKNVILAKEVLYAPSLVGIILSVRQLTKAGFNVSFKNNLCCINLKEKNVGVADIDGEMYILRQNDNVNAILQDNANCIHQWDRKLGHRDPAAIRKMFSENLANDFKIVECNIKKMCETCATGKLSRIPFPHRCLRPHADYYTVWKEVYHYFYR